MNNPTPLAQAITDATTAAQKKIEALAAALDPMFPSVVVPPGPEGIEDRSGAYGSEGGSRPGFVLADDHNFEGA